MLFDPWTLRARTAPNRVIFGPHVTNLGDRRSLSARHVAYYARRARGGAGVIVTETLSVHDSDWPYERAPLASQCAESLRQVAAAVHDHGAWAIASLGHCGLQGSTAYSQGVLWAPSLVPNVLTHEMPLVMDDDDIATLRSATTSAAEIAMSANCDGVELNAGQFSLFRQFLSGLTNLRGDEWADRSRLVRLVLDDLRRGVGEGILGVRFAADELAPWAGITPDVSRELLGEITRCVDYVVIERGSIFSESATRPDMQAGANVNTALLDSLRGAVSDTATVVAQGSIVDVADAESLLGRGLCGAVEMTRALIADPDLVAKSTQRQVGAVRPCVLCNQGCQVRDVRNPIVSCSVNPSAGHEVSDARLDSEDESRDLAGQSFVIAGAGPAGLETARRLAQRGAAVTIRERDEALGGSLHHAARLPGRDRWRTLVNWYEEELSRLGVQIQTRSAVSDTELVDVDATGAVAGESSWRDGDDGSVRTVRASSVTLASDLGSRVVVVDPVGGVLGVGVAEFLARAGHVVTLVTPDLVAGTQLSLTGDLVAANARLASLNVTLLTHHVVVALREGGVVLEDRFNGDLQECAVDVVVDAGFDRPSSHARGDVVVGDAVAPRTILAAVLEGRRAAQRLSERVLP